MHTATATAARIARADAASWGQAMAAAARSGRRADLLQALAA